MKDIKTGDLLFFTYTESKNKFSLDTFFSNVVRVFTFSNFTHVGIALVEDGEVYMVEAQIPKVRKVKLTDIKESIYVLSYDKEITDKQHKFFEDTIGQEYSIKQAVFSFFNVIFATDDVWFCTEYTNEFLRTLGIYMNSSLIPGKFMINAMNELPGVTLLRVANKQ